ncbi:efflux RND transporter periplasmic adaptor subunit [Desulfomarina sp.]
MKKGFLLKITVLLLIAAGGLYSFQKYNNSRQTDESGPLKIFGTIEIRDAALAFNEQERIKEIMAVEGEQVEVGQVLARLKTDRLEADLAELKAKTAAQLHLVTRLKTGNRPEEIEQARAEVKAAAAKVNNTRQIIARLEKTSKNGATSIQEKENAQAELKIQEAQLEVRKKSLDLALQGPRKEDIAMAEQQLKALQAKVSLLNIRLRDMTLTAPSPGIIQNRILEVGEMAGPGKPVFILALNAPKWVRAYIPEPQLNRINLGMKARVFSDSFPGRPIEGWVGFLSPVAEFTPRTVQTEDLRTKLVYEVRIFVKDEENRLRLGMPVTVTVNEKTEGR